MRLHHVQVACPRGGDDDARRFYARGLGMTEVDKPAELEATGNRLQGLGFEVDWTERHGFDGYQRFHTRDAAGNRVEVLTPR